MPSSPQIIINVAGEPSSTPGVARTFDYTKISLSAPAIRVSLLNTSGVTSYYWELVSIPEGSTAVFDDPTSASPVFYATQGRAGTYLIRCTINAGQSIGTNAIAFLTENYGLRKFAYLETQEFGSMGWTEALNDLVNAVESGSGGGGGSDPNAVYRDGSRPFIGNQSMGSNKLIGLGAAAVNGDAVRYEQWDDHETRILDLESGTHGIIYDNLTPMSVTVGGWEAGSTFTALPFADLIDGLLYPYQYPSFDAFSYSGITNPLEVGAGTTVNPTFTWSTPHPADDNIVPNSLAIRSAGSPIATGLADDGSQTVTLSAVTKLTATTHTFRVEGTDTKSNVFTRDLVVSWQWKCYYGESASAALNEAGVEGLRIGGIAAGFAGTYAFVLDAAKYKYIAYAAALGLATSFKDSATLLDIPMEDPIQVVSVANTHGEPTRTDYNVHRTLNLIGGAINIVVS